MTIKFSQFLSGGEMRVNDQVAGLRSGNNYRFDFPGTGIKDSTGAYLLKWLPGAGTPVNYVQFQSASSTNPALISAVGGDDNINLSIGAKGTGHVFFAGTGAIGVPVGTTAQEPTGFPGGFRYDTTTDYLRYWDIGANAWVDIINGAALADLTYVTNTNETADLPNSQPLSALATGIMAVTTGTGIVSSLAIPLIATNGGTGIATYTLGDTLYSSAANTLSKLAGNTTAVKQYLSQTGTGIVSAAPAWATISGGDITGAALTRVDDTNVTITLGGTPTTALLRATSLTMGWTGVLSLARGGTNANLTASNGGIFYSTATAGAILAGTATARQMLQSGATAAPAWSTATWPATTTINQLLYSSANNVVSELATANSAALVTTSAGVPVFSATMTNGQLIIGSTGATPVAASLTAGTGVTITPGAGTITISVTGGAAVTSVSGTVNQINSTGGTTPVLSLSSTLIAPGTVTVGNLLLDTNTISATNAGGDILLLANTTGVVEISSNATKAGILRFKEPVGGGTNFVAFQAPALAGDTTYQLPNAYPAVTGYVLSSTDAGVMSWVTNTAGSVTSIATGVGLQGGPITTTGTVNLSTTNAVAGRLTLTTGVPVTTTDVTGAGTLYYTPYKGFDLDVYSGAGSVWTRLQTAEISIAIPGTINTAYDAFVYDNAGTATLELTAWASLTARATAIVYQNGVLCKSGALTRRYLGSIFVDSSGAGKDAVGFRYVWNYYNRVTKQMSVFPNTTWNTAVAFAQANASSGNQLNMMIGVSEDIVTASTNVTSYSAGGAVQYTAIGLDVSNAPASDCIFSYGSAGTSIPIDVSSYYSGVVGIGYHALTFLTGSNGTATFDATNANSKGGMVGSLLC